MKEGYDERFGAETALPRYHESIGSGTRDRYSAAAGSAYQVIVILCQAVLPRFESPVARMSVVDFSVNAKLVVI